MFLMVHCWGLAGPWKTDMEGTDDKVAVEVAYTHMVEADNKTDRIVLVEGVA